MTLPHRRSFLPALVMALVCWVLFGWLVVFVDPASVRDLILPGSYLPFFFLVFFAVFLSAALLFGHRRRGFLLAVGVSVFLWLRLVGLGEVLNAILLGAFLLVLELWFSARA